MTSTRCANLATARLVRPDSQPQRYRLVDPSPTARAVRNVRAALFVAGPPCQAWHGHVWHVQTSEPPLVWAAKDSAETR